MPKGIDLTEIAGYSSEDGKLLVEIVSLLNSGYRVFLQDPFWPNKYGYNQLELVLRHPNMHHAVQTTISKDKLEEIGIQYFIEQIWQARYAMENPDKLED